VSLGAIDARSLTRGSAWHDVVARAGGRGGLSVRPAALPAAAAAAAARAALRAWIEPPSLRSVDAFLGAGATQPLPRALAALRRAPGGGAAAASAASAVAAAAAAAGGDAGATDAPLWAAWRAARAARGAPPVPSALDSLAWASLGARYDWRARAYEDGASARPLAAALAALYADAAAAAGGAAAARGGANSGLLNVYRCARPPPAAPAARVLPRAPMRAHVDDAAGEDLSAPVVGLSLGCAAVFLVETARGGAALPLLLRAGDVYVLSGAARAARHGIARVLRDDGDDGSDGSDGDDGGDDGGDGGGDGGARCYDGGAAARAPPRAEADAARFRETARLLLADAAGRVGSVREEADFAHFFRRARVSVTLRRVL
jgi:alkylated DNA repair dioxygenase AlkB